MTDFNFYSETYCGSLIPADAWDAVCRDAEAQMNRYERIYHVSYPQTGSRNMAVCAMAEALYEFAPELTVCVARGDHAFVTLPLHELLPHGFGPKSLHQGA